MFFIVGLVVPIQMTLVPLTLLLRQLDLIDNLFGLFWLYLGFGLPFAILVLRGYMRSIPRELVDAALIDGCSWFGVFRRSRPAALAARVVSLPDLRRHRDLERVHPGADLPASEHQPHPAARARQLPDGVLDGYELLAAAQCISIVPLVVIYLFFQRYFVDGLVGLAQVLTCDPPEDHRYAAAPEKMHRVIVNTMRKNEADDQYAIVHALLTPSFDLHGIIPAHFGALKSQTSLRTPPTRCTRSSISWTCPGRCASPTAPSARSRTRRRRSSAGAEMIIRER
jgi:hypothetical protein